MKNFFFLLIFSALLVGCGDDGEDSVSSSSDTITISGTLNVSSSLDESGGTGPLALIDSYSIYCVAFNGDADSCTSTLDSDGAFSCTGIPVDTPFGCFILNGSSVAATFEFVDSTEGFGNETSSSVALNGSVDLGELNYAAGTDTVEILRDVLEDNFSEVSAVLDVDDIHNTTWNLECVSGNCDKQLEEGMPSSVFFRVLKAQVNFDNGDSSVMRGFGVWASETAFNNCGGIDLTDDIVSGISTEESGRDGVSSFSFTQIDSGSTWGDPSWDNSACPSSRENGDGNPVEPEETEEIENLYILDKIVVSGNTFTIYDEEEDSFTHTVGSEERTCVLIYTMSLSFNPTSTTEMFGNMYMSEYADSGCEGSDVTPGYSSNNAVIKFTKVTE